MNSSQAGSSSGSNQPVPDFIQEDPLPSQQNELRTLDGTGSQVEELIPFPGHVREDNTAWHNRKGLHHLVVTPADLVNKKFYMPPKTPRWKRLCTGLKRMLVDFNCRNISCLVAAIFTGGSALWIISSGSKFAALNRTGGEVRPVPTDLAYISGITAFLGSVTFFIAGLGLMLEVVNQNDEPCNGWEAVEYTDDKGHRKVKCEHDEQKCSHRHHKRFRLSEIVWYPTWQRYRTVYKTQAGFWSSSVQALSSLIFLVPSIMAIPDVYRRIESKTLIWGFKLAACVGFLVSAVILIIELQAPWWKPAPCTLRWQIAMFKTVGSIAFLLMAIFGLVLATPISFDRAEWAAALSCLLGSIFFLIASLMLWYECSSQYPIEVIGPRPRSNRDDNEDNNV